MKRIGLCIVVCMFAVLPLQAQNFDNFVAEVGGGFNIPAGPTSRHASNGWNFVAAAGPRVSRNASVLVDFSFNKLNVDHLDTFDEDVIDANMRMWSITINPSFEVVRRDRWSWLATGGYGVYNRRLDFEDATFPPTRVCDDWWDICTGNNFVTSTAAFGEQNTYKGGFNVGTGFTFGTRTKFFAEVRYHHMFTTNVDTQIFPFNFGVRW
jgi:outer membrane protease